MPVPRRSLRGRVSKTVAAELNSPEVSSVTTRSSSNQTSVIGGTDTPATSIDEEYETSKVETKLQRTVLRRSARNSVARSSVKKEEESDIDLEEPSLKRKASEVFVEIVTKKIESVVPQAKKVRILSPSRNNRALTYHE